MSTISLPGLSLSIFGESHGEAVGVVIDSPLPGIPINLNKLQKQLDRRAPHTSTPGSTTRKEKDIPQILSGFYQGHTTGTPLCAIFPNEDADRTAYDIPDRPLRPGHADFSGQARYYGYQDPAGGGHFSGRLTAPLVFSGAVCAQVLDANNISIFSHILSLHGKQDVPFDSVNPDVDVLKALKNLPLPTLSDAIAQEMHKEITQAKKRKDSVGGVIECMAVGLPAGVGSPMFHGLENDLSSVLFGIPGVKGVSFGNGFGSKDLYGSQNNDAFYCESDDVVKTKTNHHGGILGGISTGMPLLCQVAIKPTPTIGMPQPTIGIHTHKAARTTATGRHDACILPRAISAVEAAMAIVLYSHWTSNKRFEK